MTDTAPQVEVTAIEAPDSGEVLAEAAVASAAVSGAAIAEAGNAKADAAQAQSTADSAQAQAQGAAAIAAEKPSGSEVDARIDAKVAEALTALATALKPPAPVAEATATVEAPAKDEPPTSIKKKARKATFAERYLGVSGGD